MICVLHKRGNCCLRDSRCVSIPLSVMFPLLYPTIPYSTNYISKILIGHTGNVGQNLIFYLPSLSNILGPSHIHIHTDIHSPVQLMLALFLILAYLLQSGLVVRSPDQRTNK